MPVNMKFVLRVFSHNIFDIHALVCRMNPNHMYVGLHLLYVSLPSLQEDLGFILGTPYINFILLSLYYILHLFLDSLALIINLSYIHSMSVLLSL